MKKNDNGNEFKHFKYIKMSLMKFKHFKYIKIHKLYLLKGNNTKEYTNKTMEFHGN